MMTTETSIYEYARQDLERKRNSVALRYYGSTMTYGRLFEKIDNVADHLARLGVGRGTVVAIHLPNCPQAVMAVYAVAKLGGICGMVHPQMPASALRDYMEKTKSRILITSSINQEMDRLNFAEVLIVAQISAHFSPIRRVLFQYKNKTTLPEGAVAFEKMERPCPVKAEPVPGSTVASECAFYFHSSGTTGAHKIVMHSHAVCNRYVANTQEFLGGYDFADSITATTLPMFHAAGLLLVYHQFIAHKAQLILVLKFDPRETVRLIHRYGIDMLGGVPVMYRALLAEPTFNPRRAKSLVRCYVFGDTVRTSLKKAFDSRVDPSGRRVLLEAYSLSEFALGGPAEREDAADRPGSTGKPQPGSRIALLEGDRIIHGVGDGEILIAGDTMMLGYLNDSRNERIFVQEGGTQWLRTGDYGRVDEDGYVYVLGRLKNMIIRNGYNVFPSELEALFQNLDGIRDVCAVGVYNEDRETQDIVVCLIPSDGERVENIEREARTLAQQSLPHYAQPRRFVFMEKFPANATGKVDRVGLAQTITDKGNQTK